MKTSTALDDIKECCRICERATVLNGKEYVVCKKNGVMPADSRCRSFSFDALKRVPVMRPKPAFGYDVPETEESK